MSRRQLLPLVSYCGYAYAHSVNSMSSPLSLSLPLCQSCTLAVCLSVPQVYKNGKKKIM